MKPIMCVMSLAFVLAAAPAITEELPVLVPAPQRLEWTSGEAAWLKTAALTGVAATGEAKAVEAALDRLRARSGNALTPAPAGNLRLAIGDLPKSIPAKTRHEAYELAVDSGAARITAEAWHGVHNGLVSLAGLVTDDGRIPCVRMLDWPDQKMRGTYVPGIDEAEARFDQFVALKLNLLLLEDGQLFDLDQPEISSRFQELAARCQANFIDFVPELQSLGWGHFVLRREPRCVEARWVDAKPFPVKDGRVYSPDPALPPAVKVENPSFDSGMDDWRAQTLRSRWRASEEKDAQAAAAPGGRGGKALKLVCEDGNTVRIDQDVDVMPNARYELRCMLKTENVTGQGAFVEVYGIEKDGRFGAFIGRNSHQRRGTTDWAAHSVQFETGPHHRARPGGALSDKPEGKPYERVRLYLRVQEGAGTAWFDDIEVRPLQAMNPLDNAVVTDTAKVLVQREDGSLSYEEGKDYTLEVPALKSPFEEGDPLGVVLTPGSRIENGATVLLSFNQANREDITCCPSEPLYQEFLRDAIHNVIRELKPKYLHIGHDEPRFFNRDRRCTERGLSNEELFVDDIKRTREFAIEADPGVRIMMWDDAINPYQNGPSLDTSDAAKHLPKDIIVNIWWYDNAGWESQMDKSLAYFLELGFESTGSPWFRIPNAWHWAELLGQNNENPKSLGVIYTSWETATPWAALEFTAEQAWSFGNPAYQQEP